MGFERFQTAVGRRGKTLRECIERGGRGEFAKALLAYLHAPSRRTRIAAFHAASDDDHCKLRRAFSRAEQSRTVGDSPADIVQQMQCELFFYFPGFAHLDEPASEWTDLRGEQS